jgi:hypothetical protein
LVRPKKLQNAKIRVSPVAVAGFRPESLTGSRLFWPDLVGIFRIRPDQWQDPVISGMISGRICPDPAIAGWIPTILARSGRLGRNPAIFRPKSGGRHPAPAAWFRRTTIRKFWQSDIKHTCKNEEFNFEKWFTVLKIVNRFLEIKEAFTVKLKKIFVDHYFRPYQTP